VKGLQDKFPLYKDNFPLWSLHSTGMMQYVVWTSFAVEGMGASLQHYSPWWTSGSTKIPARLPLGSSSPRCPSA
jgi:predicted oxidoreductase (fatty acid repression mutant protein)